MIQELMGGVLIISGLSLTHWAKRSLGPFWHPLPKAIRLVICGPYKKIHHPMYIGGALWVSGVFIFLSWWQALAAFLPLYTVIQSYRACQEEEVLENTFSILYQNYRERLWLK